MSNSFRVRFDGSHAIKFSRRVVSNFKNVPLFGQFSPVRGGGHGVGGPLDPTRFDPIGHHIGWSSKENITKHPRFKDTICGEYV